MTVQPFFNIGVACTDAHLGTPAAERIAMIVADLPRTANGKVLRRALQPGGARWQSP